MTEKKNYCDTDGWCTTIQEDEPHDSVCRYYSRVSEIDDGSCFFAQWGKCLNKQARAETEVRS